MITLSHIHPSSSVTGLYTVDPDAIRELILDHMTEEYPLPKGFQYYLTWQDTPAGLEAHISIIVSRLNAPTTAGSPQMPVALRFDTDQPDFVPASLADDPEEDLD